MQRQQSVWTSALVKIFPLMVNTSSGEKLTSSLPPQMYEWQCTDEQAVNACQQKTLGNVAQRHSE